MVSGKIHRTIQRARRQKGNTNEDLKLLDALENAALFTSMRNMALITLRDRVKRLIMECDGQLFHFMLQWFIAGIHLPTGTAEDQLLGELQAFRLKPVNEQLSGGSSLFPAAEKILHSEFFIQPQGDAKRIPYKAFVDEHRQVLERRFPSVIRDLAMYEEDKTLIFPEPPLKFSPLKLAEPKPEELMELATTLLERQQLFRLCEPKPMLTHLENFQIALLHTRLWLLGAELPLCFGYSPTYKDLRSKTPLEPAFEELLAERAAEPLPSVLEVDHMWKTVKSYSRLKDTEEVYYMKEEDYLKTSRWNRPGHPVIITKGNKEKSLGFITWRPGLEEDEDARQTVVVFETSEPRRVVARLRCFNPKSFAMYSVENRPVEM